MPKAVKKKRTSGPSGPTQTKCARRIAGRVRVDVWLSEEAAARLDELRGERSRREAIEEMLEATAKVVF